MLSQIANQHLNPTLHPSILESCLWLVRNFRRAPAFFAFRRVIGFRNVDGRVTCFVADLIAKLERVTRELKEDVHKHTDELRNVHEAAAVSCGSQLEMLDNMRGTLARSHPTAWISVSIK